MLDKIEMFDFCQFEKAVINLKKRGLVWVSGDNRDDTSASSNGSGKSTIANAISWGLYGKLIDRNARNDEIGDAVIREGAKKASVQIFLGSGWRITRMRAKGKPSLFLLDPDGDEYAGGDIQERIIQLVGLDFHGFKNTCLFGQNDTTRFASPDLSDAKRKEMLHKLLRTDVLSDCSDIAKKRYSERKKENEKLDNEYRRIAAMMGMIDVAKLKESELAWETARENSLETLRGEIVELKEKASLVAAGASRAAELRLELESTTLKRDVITEGLGALTAARKELDFARTATTDNNEVIRDLHGSLLIIKEKIASLKGERCEICDSDLKTGTPKEKVEKLRVEFGEKSDALKKYKLDTIKLESKEKEKAQRIRDIDDRISKKVDLQEKINELNLEIVKAEGSAKEATAILENAKGKLKALKEIKARENIYTASLTDAEERFDKLNKEYKAAKELADQAAEDLNLMSFWVKGFGAQGLQSFVLDESMPYLTDRANHYLETLSDGNVQVEFKTQKDMKSGSLKDEIKISWSISGVEGKTPSGGQQQKIEIATDFAFMDLSETREGASLDIFIADEILDNLDDSGAERAFDLLVELRKRRGTILVISHKPSMSEIFEHQISVIKENGISRIEES